MSKLWIIKLMYHGELLDTLIVSAETEAQALFYANTKMHLPQLEIKPLDDPSLLTDVLPEHLRDGLVKKLLSET